MRMQTKFLALIAAGALCSVPAVAQTGSQPGGQSSGSMSGSSANSSMSRQNGAMADQMGNSSMNANSGKSGDKMFVKKMIQGNQAEIDTANIALQKSSNDQVKQFAQKMIDDHTKLKSDMVQLAQQENITVPDGVSPKDKATAAKLQALSGTAFDKAYAKDMVKDHTQDVAEVSHESQSGTDPQVKDAATKALPIIQQHLDMAKKMNQSVMSAQ